MGVAIAAVAAGASARLPTQHYVNGGMRALVASGLRIVYLCVRPLSAARRM